MRAALLSGSALYFDCPENPEPTLTDRMIEFNDSLVLTGSGSIELGAAEYAYLRGLGFCG